MPDNNDKNLRQRNKDPTNIVNKLTIPSIRGSNINNESTQIKNEQPQPKFYMGKDIKIKSTAVGVEF